MGYVSDQNVVDDCGCSFYWPGEERKSAAKQIFSSDFGDTVWMNLDGQDVRLRRIKSDESMENIKKGRRHYEIYEYAGLQIRLDYLATWTCEADMPESESCEVTYYDLKITFTKGGQHSSTRAKGLCGC